MSPRRPIGPRARESPWDRTLPRRAPKSCRCWRCEWKWWRRPIGKPVGIKSEGTGERPLTGGAAGQRVVAARTVERGDGNPEIAGRVGHVENNEIDDPVGGRGQVHFRGNSRTGLGRGELAGGGGIGIKYVSRRIVSEQAGVETRSERHGLAGVLGESHAENVAGIGLKLVTIELQPRANRRRRANRRLWADWRGRADLLIHRRNAAVQRHNRAGRIRRRAVPFKLV